MRLDKIKFEKFKGLSKVELELSSVNYLVGGNNAGKSSILQAIHTAVTAAQTAAETGRKIIHESQLKYSPTGRFEDIGHQYPLENNSNGNRCIVTFIGEKDDENDFEESYYKIQLYRGRNAGAGVERSGQYIGFGAHVTKKTPPFSIYVPGLAGISHFEELRGHNVIIKKIAGGEANSVLRNVLLLLKREEKLDELVGHIKSKIFPEFQIKVNFNEVKNQFIDIKVKVKNGESFKPLDLMGTGVLQSIQLFAYTILFKPTLLLLDEPDAHLHPSNQQMIVQTLETISEETQTKILLATHSRHMINSATSNTKVFWVKDGEIKSEGDIDKVKLLNELGALDHSDELTKEVIILTEDNDKSLMKKLLVQIDIDQNRVGIVSYNGVANHNVAIQVVKDLGISPEKVIVHRDRDFLTDNEVEAWEGKVKDLKAIPYITPYSDTEMLFINKQHLAKLVNKGEDEIIEMIKTLVQENDDEFRKKFKDKRREHNRKYRDGGSPRTDELCPDDTGLKKEHILGKILIKKIRSESNRLLGVQVEPTLNSGVELAEPLKNMINELLD